MQMADITEIAKHMEGAYIEDVQVVYGEDTLIITINHNGQVSTVEMIVDSIYLEIDE